MHSPVAAGHASATWSGWNIGSTTCTKRHVNLRFMIGRGPPGFTDRGPILRHVDVQGRTIEGSAHGGATGPQSVIPHIVLAPSPALPSRPPTHAPGGGEGCAKANTQAALIRSCDSAGEEGVHKRIKGKRIRRRSRETPLKHPEGRSQIRAERSSGPSGGLF